VRLALERHGDRPIHVANRRLHVVAAIQKLIDDGCDVQIDPLIPGRGARLKVPLGKLQTERMVPLDEDSVALVDRIVQARSPALGSLTRDRPTGRVPVHPVREATSTLLATAHPDRPLRRGSAVAWAPGPIAHYYASSMRPDNVALRASAITRP
jgi:hypothetical protein